MSGRLQESSGSKHHIKKSYSVPLMSQEFKALLMELQLEFATRLNGNSPIQEQRLDTGMETGEGQESSEQIVTKMNFPVESSLNEAYNIAITLQHDNEPFTVSIEENTDVNFVSSLLVIGKTR